MYQYRRRHSGGVKVHGVDEIEGENRIERVL